MKISVIIPTYKPQEYFKTCLSSIQKQTLSKDDFEVIIILNGCNAHWIHKVTELIECYSEDINIIFLHTSIPGVSNARNMGLEIAKGEYITFIDDDDYVSPSYLENLLACSSKDCVGLSDSIYVDDSTNTLNLTNIHHQEFIKLHNDTNPTIFSCRRFFNGPVMKLLHRSIIGDRKFDIKFKNGEDSLFMALISDRIKQIKFCTPDTVYYRRIRVNSATTKPRGKINKFNNSLKLIKKDIYYWIKRPYEYNFIFMCSRILASIKP